jgi:hypothetical protein
MKAVVENDSMTTKTYELTIETELQTLETAQKHHKIRSALLFLTVVIFCVTAIFWGAYRDTYKQNKQYEAYLRDYDNSLLSMELLEYKDVYSQFEQMHLGNSNAQIQMGGYFAQKDGISIYPSSDGENSLIMKNDVEYQLSTGRAAYVNIVDSDTIIYRNSLDRNVYKYNISSSQLQVLISGNIGELLLVDTVCYYIDYASDKAILAYDLETEKITKVVSEQCESFAFAGADILYLNTDGQVKLWHPDNQSKEVLLENIDHMVYNGALYVENSGSIYQTSLRDIELIPLELGNDGVVLLGAFNNVILFEKGYATYVFSLDDRTSTKLTNEIIVGISEDISQYIICSSEGNIAYCNR